MQRSFGDFIKELGVIIEQGRLDNELVRAEFRKYPFNPWSDLSYQTEDARRDLLRLLRTSEPIENTLEQIWKNPAILSDEIKEIPREISLDILPTTSRVTLDKATKNSMVQTVDVFNVRFSIFLHALEEAIRIYFRRYSASENSEATKPTGKSSPPPGTEKPLDRRSIVRKLINSATDFRDRPKMKILCTALDEADIPIPVRKARWEKEHKERFYFTTMGTWMGIWNQPRRAEYNWITDPRKSPLLNDLYRAKKRTMMK